MNQFKEYKNLFKLYYIAKNYLLFQNEEYLKYSSANLNKLILNDILNNNDLTYISGHTRNLFPLVYILFKNIINKCLNFELNLIESNNCKVLKNIEFGSFLEINYNESNNIVNIFFYYDGLKNEYNVIKIYYTYEQFYNLLTYKNTLDIIISNINNIN